MSKFVYFFIISESSVRNKRKQKKVLIFHTGLCRNGKLLTILII